ncbi:MAG: hypothetical protein HQM10_07830 [Candidatus Riflebacteria bacterium]|nr:hypothetical protein [Candidatus Riflebacteria bacterium]
MKKNKSGIIFVILFTFILSVLSYSLEAFDNVGPFNEEYMVHIRDIPKIKTLPSVREIKSDHIEINASKMNTKSMKPSSQKEKETKTTSAKSSKARTLVSSAKKFLGYNTRKGPSGGNLACAWFVSLILRSANLVPNNWMETSARGLMARLMTEFGWKKTSISEVRAGDVIFWGPSSHVGVAVDGRKAISNSSSTKKGTIHSISGYYSGWKPQFAVRPPESNK